MSGRSCVQLVERDPAVRGGADDGDVGIVVEHGRDHAANDDGVIDDEDADAGHRNLPTLRRRSLVTSRQ